MSEAGPEAGLLVSTRKGLLVGRSSGGRSEWEWSPLAFAGWLCDYAMHDPRDGSLWAGVSHEMWGPRIHRSTDGGETWQEMATPTFAEGVRINADGGGDTVRSIWTIQPGGREGELYAGVDPGALFISRDGGASWELCKSLANHPTLGTWMAGAAGLSIHHISIDPRDPNRILVAGSATGCYLSRDGGETWTPRNLGLRALHLPPEMMDAFSEEAAGHCIHSMHAHPQQPERIWQQNHWGQYRSDDGGETWVDIGEGLPGEFGFATAIDPRDPDTAWYVPLDQDQARMPRGGELTVFRTRDAGASWKPLREGLPTGAFHQTIYRQALGVDQGDPVGLYMGTSGGELMASADAGERWTTLRRHLAAITAVRAWSIG